MNARAQYLIRSTACCLALKILLLPGAAFCQVPRLQPNDPKVAIDRIKAGSFSNADIGTVAGAGAMQQVLPALEQQFASATGVIEQGIIAKALILLGDKKPAYWDFLLKQATLAVESDLPDPFHDPQGNTTGQQPSPDFQAWVRTHQVEFSVAFMSWSVDLPGKVLLLGETGDPRAIPLLRQALQSQNHLIVVMAAKGLALVQDIDATPLIGAAIQRAPPQFRSLIAESLVYFDDPMAQSIVDNYMTKADAAQARHERARGRGAFGW